MVLQELGGKLTAALQKMQSVTVISEEVLDKMLKDIAAALLEADVNVRVVGQLRKAIKTRAALEEEVAGANRRKLIQRAVVDELVNIVDPGVQPHEVKKGKPNVIMFVGLQGAGKTTTIAKFANYYQRKGFKCCMVCDSASRGAAAPSRHRRASSPGEQVVGGLFFDFGAVRTESRDHDAHAVVPHRYARTRSERVPMTSSNKMPRSYGVPSTGLIPKPTL